MVQEVAIDRAHKNAPDAGVASRISLGREPTKAKFCEGELCKRELENILLPMLEKYEIVL
jgi:hypothetical protein